IPRSPLSTLFPYTTLFRSARAFGRHQVLRSVTFAARRGEMVGIVGENGAGKSTLLRVIAGLLLPSRGRVDLRGRIGYCPQEPQRSEEHTSELQSRENLVCR